MYDTAFTQKTLSREIRKKDFGKHPSLLAPNAIQEKVKLAYEKAKNSLPSLQIKKNKVRDKTVYHIDSLEEELIIRKINANLKILTRVKQNDRDGIVLNIIRLLEENVSYRIYRLDIKKFYESIDPNHLHSLLHQDNGVTRDTARLLKAFFSHFYIAGAEGVPRGLSLSATLSEYAMRGFDHKVKKLENVQFYSRFVDDIIIITNGLENPKAFTSKIRKSLFKGLNFNSAPSKKTIHSVTSAIQDDSQAHQFDFVFLGYVFKVFNPNQKKTNRIIKVDIAKNKVSKIKSRLIKTLIAFSNDSDFDLLESRIRILTSNFIIYDINKMIERKAGIYFSYRYISDTNSEGLTELDAFLKKALLSGSGKIFLEVKNKLNKQQKNKLLKYSFVRGFKNKTMYDFPPTKLKSIMECWAHG